MKTWRMSATRKWSISPTSLIKEKRTVPLPKVISSKRGISPVSKGITTREVTSPVKVVTSPVIRVVISPVISNVRVDISPVISNATSNLRLQVSKILMPMATP